MQIERLFAHFQDVNMYFQKEIENLSDQLGLIKSRNNLHHHIGRLIQFVKANVPAGSRIKIMLTDNELIKTQCLEYCGNHPDGKVKLPGYIPYEHGQIGEIERSHRTLQDSTVKALYNKPHLDEKCWGMAESRFII